MTNEVVAGQQDHGKRTTTTPTTDDATLFDVAPPPVVGRGAYGPVVRQAEPQLAPEYPDWQRGPASRPSEPRDRHTAVRNADPSWVAAAVGLLETFAATGTTFSADDLRDGLPTTTSGTKALGGVFSDAAARGLIEVAGFGPSRSASRRGGAIRLWRGRAR